MSTSPPYIGLPSTPLTGRQISRDHTRAIAETGGAIGTWHFFPCIEKYVDGLKEMADVVGVDHVCIETDQQVSPGIVQDYSKWVHLVGAMLTAGFTPQEAGKIAGDNYMRIFVPQSVEPTVSRNAAQEPSGNYHRASRRARLVQKEIAVAGRRFRILVDGDDDRSNVLIAPAHSRGDMTNFLQSHEEERRLLLLV